jgi:hypothetical protein
MPYRAHRRLSLKRDPTQKIEQSETATYGGYVVRVHASGSGRLFVYNRRPPEVILKLLEIWRASNSVMPLQEFIELSLDGVDPDEI